MVEVEKYIKRLLYDQDCVIIPDFGAVLTHYLPARFDSSTGKYLPSQRKVAFNEVLKIDDGLLAKFISENEGMGFDQAQRHIRDFVQTVQSLIKKNKAVTLNGIGSFHLNMEGRIVFQPDQTRNFHSEFYGLQAVSAINRSGSVSVSTEQDESDRDFLQVDFPASQTRKFAWGNWVSAASIACILVYVSAVLSNEPGATSSLNPIETIRTLFSSSPESENRPEKSFEEKKTDAVTVNNSDENLTVVDTTAPVLEEVAPAPVETDVKAASLNNKFHVIASVYESKSSLDKYGEQMAGKLRTLGYVEIQTLTVRDKFMLSAGSYATWNEAQKALPKLNKNAKGAWIYKQR